MSTVELRQAIIEYLTQIEDVSFLNAIKTMIETKASEEIYQLTDDQVKRVEEGRAQLKQGKTISNESLKLEIDHLLTQCV